MELRQTPKTMATNSPNERMLQRIERQLVADPQATLDELDKIDCSTSFLAFVRLMWPELEPARAFIEGWAIQAVAEHLEAVSRGEIKRIIVSVPPGFCKSTLISVMYPAWQWGPRGAAWQRFITASHTDKLTIDFNRRCRMVIESERFQRLWGDRFKLSYDQNAKIRFDNDRGGFRIAASVCADLRFRADVFQLDDPNPTKDPDSEAKTEEILQWVSEVMPTRINDPEKSAVMLIQQRVSERDVTGFLLAHELGYEHLVIPMHYRSDHPFKSKTSLHFVDPRREEGELAWPERFSADYVENKLTKELQSWGGEFAVAGQLEQLPVPRGGGLFKSDAVGFVDAAPRNATRVRGWDLAASRDGRAAFTVGVRMAMTGDGKVFVEDVVRGHWGPHEVEQQIRAAATLDGFGVTQDLPQDPGQSGKAQIGALARVLAGFDCQFSPESGSKEDRARPLAAQWNAGNVFLVKSPTWNTLFVRECASFPNGTWKDQVDAASRAYARLLLLSRRPTDIGVPIIVR